MDAAERCAEVGEFCLGRLAVRTGGVAISGPDDTGTDSKGLFSRSDVREKKVSLLDVALGELLCERLIGEFCFGEDDQAGGRFIESMNDREIGPAWLTVPEPLVETLAGVRSGGMSIEARRFVDDEEMFVLMQDARWRR